MVDEKADCAWAIFDGRASSRVALKREGDVYHLIGTFLPHHGTRARGEYG